MSLPLSKLAVEAHSQERPLVDVSCKLCEEGIPDKNWPAPEIFAELWLFEGARIIGLPLLSPAADWFRARWRGDRGTPIPARQMCTFQRQALDQNDAVHWRAASGGARAVPRMWRQPTRHQDRRIRLLADLSRCPWGTEMFGQLFSDQTAYTKIWTSQMARSHATYRASKGWLFFTRIFDLRKRGLPAHGRRKRWYGEIWGILEITLKLTSSQKLRNRARTGGQKPLASASARASESRPLAKVLRVPATKTLASMTLATNL